MKTNKKLGSPIMITDVSGNVKKQKKYEAFGNLIWSSGTHEDNREFTSKEKDPTGFHYFGARYYYGDIGRFLSPDPHTVMPGNIDLSNPQELNPYVYCYNNPLTFYDPDGKRAYFINGISFNTNETDYGQTFVNRMEEAGIENPVRLSPIYKEEDTGGDKLVDFFLAGREKLGEGDAYTSQMGAEIELDVKKDPIGKGEQVNIIGYSGGGYVAVKAAWERVQADKQVDNVVILPISNNKALKVGLGMKKFSTLVRKLRKKGVNVIFPKCDHDKFPRSKEEQNRVIDQLLKDERFH